MSHQWYWADWWKLWPTHSASYDVDFDIFFNVRSFGPLQWSYWDDKGTFAERSYRRGRKFAEEKCAQMGHAAASDFLWDCPRDSDHPFDRGIIDYISEKT